MDIAIKPSTPVAGFLLAFLLIVTVGLAVVGEFNYAMDPAHIFSNTNYERGIAKILVKGSNVAGAENYDDRILQRYIIQLRGRPPEAIVLGSSRVMQIRADVFPGITMFNHGVAGASVEDYLAIWQAYRNRGFMPRQVLIGVDPWILNHADDQTRWQSLGDEYRESLTRLGLEDREKTKEKFNRLSKKYKELIAWPYFVASAKAWKKNGGEDSRAQYHATDRDLGEQIIKRADGSLGYPPSFHDRTVTEARAAAQDYAQDPIYSLGDFTKFDQADIKMFEALIADIMRDGGRVTLFLPPYHPLVYQKLASDPQYRMVGEAQRYFVDFALRNGLRVVGSYNPSDCGLGESDFFDGMHPKGGATMSKLLACPAKAE